MIKDKKAILAVIDSQRVVPLISHADADLCIKLTSASYKGGLRILEFAVRTSNAEDVFKKLKAHVEKEMPDMLIGVGSIITRADAEKYIGLGASFVVAPIINAEVGEYCQQENIFWCPGGGTLTEIVHAHKLGADLVKIFPAETLGGPTFVKAIKGPCPWVNVMPTGGVTIEESNLKAWFDSGVRAVGIGSSLFTKEILESGTEEEISKRMADLLERVKKVRA